MAETVTVRLAHEQDSPAIARLIGLLASDLTEHSACIGLCRRCDSK